MATLKVNGNAPRRSFPASLPSPPPSTDLAQLTGPAFRGALLNDYSFTIFWAFAKFVQQVEDLEWLRRRVDDPTLADHYLLPQARRDLATLQDKAILACHSLVSDEMQASRLWMSLTPAERAQHGGDEAWDVDSTRPDLIGVIWDTWAPGQFPAGWSLRSFLMFHEHERPAYAAYQRRGLIDTPVIVGTTSTQARAREIRQRKFAESYGRSTP